MIFLNTLPSVLFTSSQSPSSSTACINPEVSLTELFDDWPLTVSTSERALFELLDGLPNRESFQVVDKLVEGLASLSPNRLQKLLSDCHSVKVKRLFFFFAGRHLPAWLKRIDRNAVDLGKGDRMLVRGGKFDPVHRITVPEDLGAV